MSAGRASGRGLDDDFAPAADQKCGHFRDAQQILLARGPPAALVGDDVVDALGRDAQANGDVCRTWVRLAADGARGGESQTPAGRDRGDISQLRRTYVHHTNQARRERD